MTTPQVRACAVCGRVLDTHERNGQLSWAHTARDQPEDHPAVPVTPDQIEVIGRCDFCTIDFPSMIIPARSFLAIGNHVSEGDWGACDTCADLIANNRWDGLLRRASKMQTALPELTARAYLQPFYNKLRRNITGKPRRPVRSSP